MQNFIHYLQSKNHAATTQQANLRKVNSFLSWFKKEPINCAKKDILSYLEYLQNQKQHSNIARRNVLIALNHYFTFLHKNKEINHKPTALIKIRGTKKQHLYTIYSAEELHELHDNYYHTFIRNYSNAHLPRNQRERILLSHQRNYIMLGLLIHQGLHTNELQKINLADVDLQKAKITIAGGKKSNARTLNLHASQIGALINYMENIRPDFFTNYTETEFLFFSSSEFRAQKIGSNKLMNTFKPLSKQVKSINKNLCNLNHLRASVITHWLKTYGLRKTQYMAGHRYISSTEKYLPNNLDELTGDIEKYNPF